MKLLILFYPAKWNPSVAPYIFPIEYESEEKLLSDMEEWAKTTSNKFWGNTYITPSDILNSNYTTIEIINVDEWFTRNEVKFLKGK